MRGSNVLKMSSVKAHGHTGSPPHLGHPWQKQHMEVHIAIRKHVGTPPPVGVPTADWLVGTLMVCSNIFVVKPAYRKRAFLVCIPKMGRSSAAPPSGHTGSHASFIHPKHQQTETGKAPPTAQGEWGEGGMVLVPILE
jgi:hypothetical protein